MIRDGGILFGATLCCMPPLSILHEPICRIYNSWEDV